MQTKFDVIIIGSGAGGAPIAHTLVKAGKSVLILEKGPLFKPQYQNTNGLSDFKRDELISDGTEKRVQVPGVANYGEGFYSSHVEPDINDEPHVYRGADGQDRATIEGYTAQVVGGGTQLYGGVSLRFTPTDFHLQSFNAGRTDLKNDPDEDVQREARDWPISYDELEPYYTRAEELIGFNGTVDNQLKRFSKDNYQPPLEPNPISRYAKAGMEQLGRELNPIDPLLPYRTPLAVITRDHPPSGRKVPTDPETLKTSYVNRYGCPLGAKSNTWVALLSPISDQPNFEIRANCIVTHLECDGARINRVMYRDPSGRQLSVEGNLVVVACSAIESIRLLKLSARLNSEFDQRINQNDLLGRYFLTHCFGGASALMPTRNDKSMALDADWATDCCATEDFLKNNGLWAGGAIYNNTSDQALPLSIGRNHGSQDLDTLWKGFIDDTRLAGQGLADFLDENIGRGLSVSFMANQVPQRNNRIELHPTISDKWNRPVAYIIKTWHSHDQYLMDTLAGMCGKILKYGGEDNTGEFQFLFEGQGGIFNAENALARIANHILGGARFGTDPRDSVLDIHCRAWNFDNLYVTDGAFMPTSGGANPTLTIQANSFRVADELLKRL
ncbi:MULTISPECIES: GMC oxidoreductase [Nitrosomonas]|uniref:Choline dehydrogenase-like flavoprotein n=1 Tax=Nitrosomonas communis TaxID=44574 RepID=A0A0F7KCN3_9PROT|nr:MULTISPECIES: GMC family oxidoreductase [Nitrosomonas]AKH38285.1 FAD-dependent oxidoreductase [Nitrosomonas communis]TYP80430.1 choline dehydrogenase-like flavoprotein [Nitrosomonas communis]UVS60271.1 GMC family oxidoreductase [Nitrosomonas sp. PLL12]